MAGNDDLRLRDVVALLDARYPPSTAEDWDAVGLVVGDPNAPVRKVLFAVDPVAAVVGEALDWGADLLITHHPLFLRPVHGVAATTFKGDFVHRLIRGGCALYVAHTNADAAERGVADALADAAGLVDRKPLVARSSALPNSAGVSTGSTARECPSDIGIGRVGRLPEPMTLRALAERIAAATPATAQGVRVSGDLDALVETVAVVGGAGDSLFDAVRAANVDVYVTADLRHHPASELREQAEFEASAGIRGFDRLNSGAPGIPLCGGLGWNRPIPYLIDLAHFASEWPWLAYAAEDLAADVATVNADSAAPGTVECKVSVTVTDPWTTVIANPR